jgi:soluble lytic murein transglycosylase-like protein
MSGTDPRDRRNTEMDTGTPSRRGGDHAAGTSSAPTAGRSPRDVFRRFRQPLIGLGLAGLAIPMVQATSGEQAESEEAEPADERDTYAPEAAADPEEQLVERIAVSQEEQAREEQVDRAVEQYGINRDLAEDIYDIARETNIEPRLAYGLVKTESTFNERAVSPVGARGLTQVMPRTAAWLVPGTRTQDLYDRQTNLRLGFTYLDQMIAKYKGNVRLALLAYNRGPGTVDKVLKRGGNPDNGYADKVLRG